VDSRAIDGRNYVHLNGGRLKTDIETADWIKQAEELGAGEILLTSMDYDGTKNGFDCTLLKEINQSIRIPLIASGGAGTTQHFIDVFKETKVDAALAASVFHYDEILIPGLKQEPRDKGIIIR